MSAKVHYGAMALMRSYLPDFCWQTSYDILLMLEQADIDSVFDYNAVKTILCSLIRSGFVVKRKFSTNAAPKKGSRISPRYEYIRNPTWSKKCPKKH